MSTCLCSVIIPSFNRRVTLEMVLCGLERQTMPSSQFEVIVVLDGGTDDSAAMLAEWQHSNRLQYLRWIVQANSGQAAARNRGAREASTPILAFINDDVVPEPKLLAIHMRWHHQNRSQAILGDCRLVRAKRYSPYHPGVWSWWKDKYHQRALPGRQPGYRDFCAGNASLRRDDFLAVGGFDTAFQDYGGEDYELGYRLQHHGVELVADREAQARHYHRTSVNDVLRATRQEAHGDFLLGRKHPHLRPGLRIARLPAGNFRLLARLVVQAPALGDRLMLPIQYMLLPIFERARMRWLWRRWFDHLRGYAYWRGVCDTMGSWEVLQAYQRKTPMVPEQHLDLSDGLPAVMPPFWIDGPSRVMVTYHGQQIGTLTLETAIEAPLREYLAVQLIEQLGPQLWLALSHNWSLPWSSYLQRNQGTIQPVGSE